MGIQGCCIVWVLATLAACHKVPSPAAEPIEAPIDAPVSDPESAPEATAAEPSAPAAEAPREPEPDLVTINDGAGVYNGQFDETTRSTASFWKLEPGPGGVVADAGQEKSPGLRLPGNYYYNTAIQHATFSKPVNGRTIRMRADCYAEEPGTAKLGIKFSDAVRFSSAEHPGDGTWQTLDLEAEVPAGEASFTQADVLLSHFNQPKKPMVWDNVVLEVVPR